MRHRISILISAFIPGLASAEGVTDTAKEGVEAVVGFVISPAQASVPEPSTMALLALGIAAVWLVARLNRTKAGN